MRKISKITGLFLGLALVLGVGAGIAVSSEGVAKEVKAATPGDSIYTSGTPSFGTSYSYGNKTLNGVDWYFSTCGNSTSMGWNKSSQNHTSSATLSVLSNIGEDTKIGAYQTSGAFSNAQKIKVTVSNLDSVTGNWYVWYSTDSGTNWTEAATDELTSSTAEFTYDHGSKIGDSVYFAFGYGTSKTTKTRINLTGIEVWEAVSTTTPTITVDSTFSADVGSNTLTVTYSNFTANTAINASSDDTTVATVTSSVTVPSTSGTVDFTVTGVKNGTATITFSSTGATSKTTTVTVFEQKEFTKITMASKLVSGGHYLISRSESATVMSTTQNTNNRAIAQTTPKSESDFSTLTTVNAEAAVLEITLSDGYYTIYDSVNDGYLYAVSGSNHLKTGSSVDGDVYLWTITFEDNHAIIANKGASGYKVKYNAGNNPNIFSCYTTAQTAIDLYLLTSELPSESSISSFTMPSGDISFENYETITFTATYLPVDATESVTVSTGANTTGGVEFGTPSLSNGTITFTITGVTAGTVNVVLTGDTSGTESSPKYITIANSSRIYNSGLLKAANISTTLGGSATTNNVTWYSNEIIMQNEEHSFTTSTDSVRGVGLGTASAPISSFELTSDLFVGVDYANKVAHQISSIIVNASVAKDGAATLSVELNGTQIGSSQNLTETATDYTFTLSSGYVGHISIKIVNSAAKAAYIGSIIVKGATNDDETETYYSMTKQLEAIDSCNISESDWNAFLANTDEGLEMTYAEIFEASETDFRAITLYDHASKDSSSLKTSSYSAYDKYIYICSRFSSGSGLKILNLFGDSTISITVIVAISTISLTSVGAFFALRKRKENI